MVSVTYFRSRARSWRLTNGVRARQLIENKKELNDLNEAAVMGWIRNYRVKHWLRKMKSRDPSVRQKILSKLEKVSDREDIIPSLIDIFHKYEYAQNEIIELLGRMQDSRAIEPLTQYP